MALREYFKSNPDPLIEEIKIALSGNICRRTGYRKIIKAAFDAI